MHRLFVAIRPPQEIRERLIDVMEGVAGVRWQSDDQLHLTLRFIGEVDRHIASDIAAALSSIHHPAFDLAVQGIGTFDRRGRPEVLWAGVTPVEPLKSLHKKVDQALQRVGLEPEHRAFQPHLTLARLKPGAGSIQPLLEKSGGLTTAPFRVASFALYESTLSREGASYATVARYSLQSPSAESSRSTRPA